MHELVLHNLEKIAELCRKHRVRRLFLFGSAVGDDFDPASSDVDFLVVFEPQERKGWDDVYFLLLADLESLLGRKVDLLEAHTLRNPYLIASINRTKQMLYAA
ncbi:MAG TPA: nucleotidyltransferase domain-containing protein [Phycisphaerales bacterium]|nr:nucleotidyltransferase domain-containing protein [Phycisphaerales bacterium]